MSNQATTANRERAASAAVQEWFDSYFFKIYGVSVGNSPAHFDTADSHPQVAADDFVGRLYARFKDLDLAPCDGEVSLFEIDRAIENPLLHFDERDMQMLRLLRRYFGYLSELHEDHPGQPEWGISRADIDTLATCLTGIAPKLKGKLEEEYGAK